MKKTRFSVVINAPKEKVWDTMLEDATYRIWTKPFNVGSAFVGDWSEGSVMHFVGCDEQGNPSQSGMYSKIRENRKYEFISIEHLGMIENGVIDTTSEEVKKWTPCFENYTFTEEDGATRVDVDMDIAEMYEEMFNDMWPKALQVLKEISEK